MSTFNPAPIQTAVVAAAGSHSVTITASQVSVELRCGGLTSSAANATVRLLSAALYGTVVSTITGLTHSQSDQVCHAC